MTPDALALIPSPLAGEGGARRKAVGGRGGLPSKEDLLVRAKQMRASPTEAEAKLWSMLRAKRFCDFKFRRQVVMAPYIVDFVNFGRRLIVEADGSQHAESVYDQRRDAYLRGQGFTVFRFWNDDILRDSNAIAEAVWHELTSPPLPSAASRLPPSPARGEGIESNDNV